MLTKLVAKGINSKFDLNFEFYKDLNVITGRNGSGKTTTIKLIWYLISGNIERIPAEMTFDYILLESDLFNLSLNVKRSHETNIKPSPTQKLRRRDNKVEISFRNHKNSELIQIEVDYSELLSETPIVREINLKIATLCVFR